METESLVNQSNMKGANMAAGTFLFENKLRPGCYVQIKGVPSANSNMSERGTVVVMMNADSGGLVTEISANDILTGSSAAKGFPTSAFSDTKGLLNYVYQYVNKIIICRLNNGGQKAYAYLIGSEDSEDSLSARAKYSGLFGNSLSVAIVKEASGEGKFKGNGWFIRTSVVNSDGGKEVVEEQNLKELASLKSNDYVDFLISGEPTLVAVASKDLTGGTNGEEGGQNLTKIFAQITDMQWNTAAYCGKDENASLFVSFIKNLRENLGKYRQGVVYCGRAVATADYEGIISPYQLFVVDDDDYEEISELYEKESPTADEKKEIALRRNMAVCYVASITAGADVNISNTYSALPQNVTAVVPSPYEDEDVEDDLSKGRLMFTKNSSGTLVVEKDINTLHTYTQTRTEPFSKNRVIRCLDELSNTKVKIWESMFIGKIDNNATGRNLFKTQIMKIMQNMQNIGALRDVGSADIVVEQGDSVDTVRSFESVRPVDAMERLYSYVTVLG